MAKKYIFDGAADAFPSQPSALACIPEEIMETIGFVFLPSFFIFSANFCIDEIEEIGEILQTK